MEHQYNSENTKEEKCCGHSSARWHHKKMRGPILVAITLLSFYLLALTVTEVRQWRYVGSGIQPTNTISVQGEGEVFAVPDTAMFSFSVIKEGETAEVVQQSATEVANGVIAYLKDNGVEEKDIKTTGYNVYPRYEWEKIVCVTYPCPQGERKLVGFEINQSIQVKVRDTKRAGEFLSGVGEFGVSNISGLSFTIDDEDDLKREARQAAVADAKEKAEALTSDLGVRLIRVVSFNEYNVPYYAARAESFYGVGGDASSVPEIPVGENRITSTVNITYEIR